MDKLSEARAVINEADREMAALWLKRMAAVRDVSDYKAEHGLPVVDASREASLLSKNLEDIPPELKGYYADFLKSVISVSKQYQRDRALREKNVIGLSLGDRSYDIIVERGSLGRAGSLMALNRKALIVTDDGVPAQYAAAVAAQCAEPHTVTLKQGEATKNLESFRLLLKTMLEARFTRKDCVVAVGGGVIGDLAGFAASAYMRGIDFYSVPTTALAQIDSSIGGKVAIDLDGYKNTVGAFWQPRFVLADPDVLITLDRRQLSAGLAEAVKMSLCFDESLFEIFEEGDIYGSLDEIIRRSLLIKKAVVEQDERESGLRQALNFGHTIGHGIETAEGGRLIHGECVALGMLPMSSPKVRQRLIKVLEKLGLPTSITADPEKVKEAMLHDKKSAQSGVTAVKVDEAGSFRLEKLEFNELFSLFDEYLKEAN